MFVPREKQLSNTHFLQAFCESVQWQQKWAREKVGFEGNIVTDCTCSGEYILDISDKAGQSATRRVVYTKMSIHQDKARVKHRKHSKRDRFFHVSQTSREL